MIVCYSHAYFLSPWIPPHLIISCACREVQFLPLGQNTCSAQQQLVGTWILLEVSLSCLTLVWLVSPPPRFPAGSQVAFWHVLLNPFWKQCREVQGKFAYNSMGGAASPFWISPWASARSSHCHSLLHLLWCIFPVHLLLCSLLTQRHIKDHLNWLNVGFRAALGPCLQGGTCWYYVPAYWGVYVVPHHDPLSCLKR